jgi:hypothetical protein
LAFAIILFAVIGAIHNRKSKKIIVTRSKFLVPGGIVSIVVIGVGILFIPVESVGNLVYILGYYNHTIPTPPDVTMPNVTIVDIVGASSQIMMLFIFLGIMFVPGAIRVMRDQKKGINKISHKDY